MRVSFLIAITWMFQVSVCATNQSKSHPVSNGSGGTTKSGPTSQTTQSPKPKKVINPATKPLPKGSPYRKATFAGGCFWCMQPPFDKLKGVISTTVGYIGGVRKNPTYKQVAYGLTKHTEAIEIIFDPKKITYAQLLQVFWRNIDPTAKNRQFVDVGTQYRSGIFYHSAAQKKLAVASKQALAKSKRFSRPIVTEITRATPFYQAETYHQKYYIKSPYSYYRYRRGSGRDQFIQKYWGKKK